jgi:uncharacterized protein
MTDSTAKARAQRFRRRVIGGLLVTIVLLFSVLPFGLSFAGMYFFVDGMCSRGTTPDLLGMPYESVTFPSANHNHPAYFIPGAHRAVVVIAPPYSGDAGTQLDYARIFHDAGLSVLSLSGRTCIDGPVQTLGYLEGVEDVVAAYTYLGTRDDVDISRVSAHGFSAAGAAALFAAAEIPELRAASAMGNYEDFYEEFGVVNASDNPINRMIKFGMRSGYRAASGISVERARPIDAIPRINPRPILFVYGTTESSLNGGREMFALAGDTSEMWEVPGAGHGNYLALFPEEGREIIGGFHRRHLLGDEAPDE